jgi:hypothetical protein
MKSQARSIHCRTNLPGWRGIVTNFVDSEKSSSIRVDFGVAPSTC